MATTNKKLTRGSEQERWLNNMLSGYQCNPVRELRGRAKNYALRYQASFQNLCNRLEQAGYTIESTPGPRGGAWGSTYRAIAPATERMSQLVAAA